MFDRDSSTGTVERREISPAGGRADRWGPVGSISGPTAGVLPADAHALVARIVATAAGSAQVLRAAG